jgi:hypothetical protein
MDDEEIITYHNNRGMGIPFAAVGAVNHQKAATAGIGRPLPSEWFRTSTIFHAFHLWTPGFLCKSIDVGYNVQDHRPP